MHGCVVCFRSGTRGGGRSGRLRFYSARDPFSHRVIVDKGQARQDRRRSPVVDDDGIVGQVTRVLSLRFRGDAGHRQREQAVPVQIVRNGLRSVVFGLGNASSNCASCRRMRMCRRATCW